MSTTKPSTVSLLLLFLLLLNSAAAFNLAHLREHFLVKEKPLVLKYHGGELLKGPYKVNLIWYGCFTQAQRDTITDFLESLSPPPSSKPPPPPSVASWWATTEDYGKGATIISVGSEIIEDEYDELRGSVTLEELETIAQMHSMEDSINVVLTGPEVTVDGFCRSSCGIHKGVEGPKGKLFPYIWVGNSETQCPGKCAWPFAKPTYGPQTPPLLPPNGDVGVDGMIINLAKLLAATVTNPYDGGYYMGPDTASLEAASACPGKFGKGAFPGYAGDLPVDKTSGGSYNARGFNGREFLLPALWDPVTSKCTNVEE